MVTYSECSSPTKRTMHSQAVKKDLGCQYLRAYLKTSSDNELYFSDFRLNITSTLWIQNGDSNDTSRINLADFWQQPRPARSQLPTVSNQRKQSISAQAQQPRRCTTVAFSDHHRLKATRTLAQHCRKCALTWPDDLSKIEKIQYLARSHSKGRMCQPWGPDPILAVSS